jgi:hypothetical protein
MPKQTRYLVFAGLLAAVPLPTLPGQAARPTGECRTTPNHRSSEGGHWYYRVDRTNHRKCWYVRPAGKVRSVTSKPGLHRVPVTQLTLKVVAEPTAARGAEQPVLPIRAAALVADDAQGVATRQQIAQPKVQNVIISARWPDPVEANGDIASARGLTDIAGAGSLAGSQSSVPVKDPDHTPARAASRAPEAAPAIHSRQMLELLAGGLAIAGAVGSIMLRHSVRRRRDVAARAYAARRSSSRDESILPILARASKLALPAPADPQYFRRTTVAARPAGIFLAACRT